MILTKLKDMKGGWFIGDFEPSVFNADFEVGIKEYKKGETGKPHFHKFSDEFTVILSGILKLNDSEYKKGDIIQIERLERVGFECIKDCMTVVVKPNSVKGDKYYD